MKKTMHLNFEIRKHLLNAIVPLECGGQHATAFFVAEDTLLTVRHAVVDHLVNKDTLVFINVGQRILCEVEILGDIDVVILRCTQHVQHDVLNLLSAEFNEDVDLMVLGYPSELGHNRDIISLSIRNRQRVENSKYDILVIREDALALYSYKGFSGSPVVNQLGSVVGIMTYNVFHTLGYISIKKLVDPWLNEHHINYNHDFLSEDMSMFGRGTSQEQISNAITQAGSRYNSKLHQDVSGVSNTFSSFLDKDGYDQAISDYGKLREWLISPKRSFYDKVQEIFERNKKTKGIDSSLNDEHEALWEYFELAVNSEDNEERMFYDEHILEYQKIDEQINDFNKKLLIVKGNAGCGKTHFLCHVAEKFCKQINVYLLFGSQFVAPDNILSQICSLLNFEGPDLKLLNEKMCKYNSVALLIIDALNEGADDSFWREQLPLLYDQITRFKHLKLILSVRSQSDDYLYSSFAKEMNVCSLTIDGFSDIDKAVHDYFIEYGIPNYNEGAIERYKDDFKNPLFLKIFCKVAKKYGIDEITNSPRSILYGYYISARNTDVCRNVDEDEYVNITLRFMMDLASYSLNYMHCVPIPRMKARMYADRICRNRTWSNNLLNVCLKENLLLPVNGNRYPSVKFEYDQLGDFLKVRALLKSKRDDKSILSFIMEEHKMYPSHHFEHFIIALLSEWDFSETMLQNKVFFNTFKNELFESIQLQKMNLSKVARWCFDNDVYEPRIILGQVSSLSLMDIKHFNKTMLKKDIYERDLKWTVLVGDLYKTSYEDDFRQLINVQISSEDDTYKYCLLLLWLCTSPHPQIRNIILRRLVSIFKSLKDATLIVSLVEDLHLCNDPYVLQVLYSASYGYALSIRDKIGIGKIAKAIYHNNYLCGKDAPLDIVVRHWTLSILAFSKELGNEDLFSKALPPYESMDPYALIVDEWESIDDDYFGSSYPSKLLFDSINSFEDFNRYIIGTNSRDTSSIFIQEKDGQHQYVPLNDIILMINNIIKHEYKWTDEIGLAFKDSYSVNRSENKTERIGKKYQWLALYKIEALLSDHCKMKDGFNDMYSRVVPETFTEVPYPWYSDIIPNIDPTLTDEDNYVEKLKETQTFDLGIYKSDEEWMNRDYPLSEPQYNIVDEHNVDWIVFNSFNSFSRIVSSINRKVYLFVNSGFIRNEDYAAFYQWARSCNFYGRWMPESHGLYEFLWNEYIWSDRFKRTRKSHSDLRPSGCPCDFILSNQGQLQEHYEGLKNEDHFLSTAYAPNPEIMKAMNLYTAQRGVVRQKGTNEVVSKNIQGNAINGLVIRKDILDTYLREHNMTLVYYISGEKELVDKHYRTQGVSYYLSGCRSYDGTDFKVIQPLRISEDSNERLEQWKQEQEDSKNEDFTFEF